MTHHSWRLGHSIRRAAPAASAFLNLSQRRGGVQPGPWVRSAPRAPAAASTLARSRGPASASALAWPLGQAAAASPRAASPGRPPGPSRAGPRSPPQAASDPGPGPRVGSPVHLAYAGRMPLTASRTRRLLWLPLLLAGCPGLFGGYDDDGGGGDGDGGWGDTFGNTSTGFVTGGDSNSNSNSNTDGDPPTTGIEPTGADNQLPDGDSCPCAANNEDIYVLSNVGSIWSFDPTDSSFEFITGIDCGGMTETFSMGVSRKARAWVQYSSGDIFTVDLSDPGSACKDPGFTNNDPLFPNFGMAFVANSVDDPCDKLYAHSGIEPGLIGPDVGALGVIDPATLVLSEIASIDYAWGELTGTGDGRLFAFQGDAPPHISQYDKATGEVLGTWPLPGLDSPGAFAFAYWGGDFYLFMTDFDDFGDGNSRVVHVDFDESDGPGKTITTIVESAPIQIVGAGVSTCAPQ